MENYARKLEEILSKMETADTELLYLAVDIEQEIEVLQELLGEIRERQDKLVFARDLNRHEVNSWRISYGNSNSPEPDKRENQEA
jgi:hypothetical protein